MTWIGRKRQRWSTSRYLGTGICAGLLALGRRNATSTGWDEPPNVAMVNFLLKVRFGWKEAVKVETNAAAAMDAPFPR